MQGHFFDGPGRADAPAVLAELEVDYTPVAVPVQFFLAVEEQVIAPWGGDPSPAPHILVPAAGSGSWARAARAVFPNAIITGIEPRASERGNLLAVCDEVHTTTFEKFIAGLKASSMDPRVFDVIADNTPFSAFKKFWPGLVLDAGLLSQDGLLAMYGFTQWGQSRAAIPNLRRWCPSFQYRVGGRIEHRGKGTQRLAKIAKKHQAAGGPTHEMRDNGGDSREYCTWVWDLIQRAGGPIGGRNVVRPVWQTEQLPELPMRAWEPSSVPGTYPIDPSLVNEIRTRYL